jgi:hypothetical protein
VKCIYFGNVSMGMSSKDDEENSRGVEVPMLISSTPSTDKSSQGSKISSTPSSSSTSDSPFDDKK